MFLVHKRLNFAEAPQVLNTISTRSLLWRLLLLLRSASQLVSESAVDKLTVTTTNMEWPGTVGD